MFFCFQAARGVDLTRDLEEYTGSDWDSSVNMPGL